MYFVKGIQILWKISRLENYLQKLEILTFFVQFSTQFIVV